MNDWKHSVGSRRVFCREVRRRSLAAVLTLALVISGWVVPPVAHANDATAQARARYESGLELFYAREHAQALIEFQRAHELKPRPATLFMMAQCEYLLGALTQAREHYEHYLRESPTGEFVDVARDRIESINRRSATLVINTVPDQVDIRITPASDSTRGPRVTTGQAPNNFSVPRGRWKVVAAKPNYLPQDVTVDVDVAETRPLFFKLDPIPARLEIETLPADATLYVNGNRARNPYRQDVPPGRYEIFAEATDYVDRTDEVLLGPGQKRLLTGPFAFQLRYVQRSGRPELVVASSLLGAAVGAGAVIAGIDWALGENAGSDVSTVSLTAGGALTGAVAGALVSNSVVPSYVPDNRALFILGGMWIGAAEGALAGFAIRQAQEEPSLHTKESDGMVVPPPAPEPYLARPSNSSHLRAAFVGSLPGLAVGITAGSIFSSRAPTYGRVAMVQSAALGGALTGGLAAVALHWTSRDWRTWASDGSNQWEFQNASFSTVDLSLPVLLGLNVGLGAGLVGAYLPDQSRYGPSWQRVVLVDLAAGAGALAAGIGACVLDSECLNEKKAQADARARTAAFALAGGGVGALVGIFLTRKMDRSAQATPTAPSLSLLPLPTASGQMVPTLTLSGQF